MIQKLKQSNAGFTLVELIVVIAILGILAVVLVPQYVQYVNKAKIASDKTALDTYLSTVKIALADESTSWAAGNITFTYDSSTGVVTPVYTAVDGAGTTKVSNAMTNAGVSTFTVKSTEAKSAFALAATAMPIITITSTGTSSWVRPVVFTS